MNALMTLLQTPVAQISLRWPPIPHSIGIAVYVRGELYLCVGIGVGRRSF
jgi:hypothetical protein